MDLANYQVDISVDLPSLTFRGDYEVSGRLLVLPLKGKGPVRANASEYAASVCRSLCSYEYEQIMLCLNRYHSENVYRKISPRW